MTWSRQWHSKAVLAVDGQVSAVGSCTCKKEPMQIDSSVNSASHLLLTWSVAGLLQDCMDRGKYEAKRLAFVQYAIMQAGVGMRYLTPGSSRSSFW
ncbi:hypothetical protein [Sporisorium scitamineum]|uniref:Uncharacterized protein n=1 Tax=Sporisorium scitamineum TaxID=49012 RepID=A0A0F7S9I6_9BASI|nr:hypothetical protein [Sporisorium scitamineum]